MSRPDDASSDPERGLPALHVVTHDEILAREDFLARAGELLACGPEIALHLRGREAGGARLHALAVALVREGGGGRVVVNDRVDVAECAGAWGVQLPAASLPVEAVRRIARRETRIGASVHTRDEAWAAADADWLFVGTLWASPSHPGRPGAGPGRLVEIGAPPHVPLVGIGGVTPARVAEAVAAGASGVATIRGVWDAPDPAGAAREYLTVLRTALRKGRGGDEGPTTTRSNA